MAKRFKWNPPNWKQGDKVWLDARNLKIPYPSKKLAPKREGPFKIEKVLGPLTYQLELPEQWTIHNVFHVALLMPFKETQEHGPNWTRPPPELVQGQEENEVEQILTHRHKGNKVQYLIKWKNYGTDENEWITEENLMNANEILETYKSHTTVTKTGRTSRPTKRYQQ